MQKTKLCLSFRERTQSWYKCLFKHVFDCFQAQYSAERIKQHKKYVFGKSSAWFFCFSISLFCNLNNLTAICRNIAFLFGTSTVFGLCSQVLLNKNFLREVGFAAGHIITISPTSWRATVSEQQDQISISHHSSHYYERL